MTSKNTSTKMEMKMKALETLLEQLKKKQKSIKYKTDYIIPSIWLDNDLQSKKIKADPFKLFIEKIENIINSDKIEQPKSKNELITYNMFVRYATAFDHNNDGELAKRTGFFKETGTFLKSILLLDHLKYLGVNTIYMLPITAIGKDRKKGNLGSPYAIRNPYKIDENLSEDILDIDIETQFKAFVEAAHHLGFKVICEFVFRTGSVDSDLAIEHPEWFYWIPKKVNDRPADSNNEKQYGPPIFTKEELKEIRENVEAGDRKELIPPHDEHINMFKEPPKKAARVKHSVIGVDKTGKELRVPGAFADWPPDDSQPVWSDVTYLKLFDHKKFNYIAYNTVRMYDEKLNQQRYAIQELWDFIIGIIPHFVENYDIDGVMIDMGHALPAKLRAEITQKANEAKDNFIFWEENFLLTEDSVKEGYDAVLGYMPFDAHEPHKIKDLIRYIQSGNCPINFFATPESHNTKRAASREGGVEFSKSVYLISAFIQAMPFILNGYELGEADPINTGLGFEQSDYEKYPAEKLPLFSVAAIDWLSQHNLSNHIHKVNEIRRQFSPNKGIKAKNIHLINTDQHELVAFVVRNDELKTELLIAVNLSNNIISANIDMLSSIANAENLLADENIITNDTYIIKEFRPYQGILIKLEY
jgi:glycosidase